MTTSFEGWDREACRRELRQVIPRVWDEFVTHVGRENATGFAVFSVVDHGYVLLSGFTRDGQAEQEPDYRWEPPESPYYTFGSLDESDFPLASDDVRHQWYEAESEEEDDEEGYWEAFLADAIDAVAELREAGRFGDDPELVLLVIDADAGQSKEEFEAMVRRLNPGPAHDTYRRVLEA